MELCGNILPPSALLFSLDESDPLHQGLFNGHITLHLLLTNIHLYDYNICNA